MKNKKTFLLSVVTAACVAAACHAVPLYVFDSITAANPGAPGGDAPLNRRPSIADTGEVVYAERYLDGATERERILVRAEDGTTRIAADEAALPLDLDFDTNPVISDDGEYISFAATDGDGVYGVYRVDSAGFVTTIVKEGDFDTQFDPVNNLTCKTGCPVTNFQAQGPQGEPDLDGRVVFYKQRVPPMGTIENGIIAASRGGDVIPLNNPTNQAIQAHQANTGQVCYTSSNGSTVFGTLNGSSTSVVSGPVKTGLLSLGDVALETFATNGPMTASVLTVRPFYSLERMVVQRNLDGGFDKVASDIGPFADFTDVSINNRNEVLFKANLDLQGHGIFTGGDAAQNRVIGVGDVLFGQTVVAVGLQKAEALNDDGNATFWAELSDGSQHIMKAQTFADYLTDQDIQMSIPKGGSLKVAQALQGAFPTTAFDLAFSPDFLTGDGILDVSLGGLSLATLRAGSMPTDGIFRVAGISPQPFQRILDSGGMLDLFFELTGPGGSTIRLDDIGFWQDDRQLGLIRNGDFETGYLDFWRIETSGDATAFLKAVPTHARAAPGRWRADRNGPAGHDRAETPASRLNRSAGLPGARVSLPPGVATRRLRALLTTAEQVP